MKFIPIVAMINFLVSIQAGAESSTYSTGPCLAVQQACTAAGFVITGPKRDLGVRVDCVQLVVNGKKENIIGPNGKKVVVDKKTVLECKKIRSSK